MPLSLILVAVLVMIQAALHLAAPFVYGVEEETIGIGFFGLAYLILGILLLMGIQLVPLSILVITAIGTFGAWKNDATSGHLQRINRLFLGLGSLIIALLVAFFALQFI